MPYCALCEKQVDQLHYDIEQWILNTIVKNNPKWVEKDGSCMDCIAYYRSLDNIQTDP